MGIIRHGSEGADVRRVQEVLRSLSYLDEPPDGIFGRRTEGAVRQFQADHDLLVDGIVGPNTQAAIDKELGTSPAHPERERDATRDVGAEPPKSSKTGRRPRVVVADIGRTLRAKVRKKPPGKKQHGSATLELLAVGSRADDFASKFTANIRQQGSADGHTERFSAGRAKFSRLRAGTYEIRVDSKLDIPWSPEPGSSTVSLRDGERKQVDVRF